MTNISAIVDQIVLKLKEVFPEKTVIPYPYSLEDNNKNFLADGFGVRVGAASFNSDSQFCEYIMDREISVVFTRECYRTDSDYNAIIDITKKLGEDINATLKLFYNYEELGIEPQIAKVDISSTSGVEEVIGGKQVILSMDCTFTFTIRESL